MELTLGVCGLGERRRLRHGHLTTHRQVDTVDVCLARCFRPPIPWLTRLSMSLSDRLPLHNAASQCVCVCVCVCGGGGGGGGGGAAAAAAAVTLCMSSNECGKSELERLFSQCEVWSAVLTCRTHLFAVVADGLGAAGVVGVDAVRPELQYRRDQQTCPGRDGQSINQSIKQSIKR